MRVRFISQNYGMLIPDRGCGSDTSPVSSRVLVVGGDANNGRNKPKRIFEIYRRTSKRYDKILLISALSFILLL